MPKRKTNANLILYRARKRTEFNIKTMRFETHTDIIDLTKTVPDQLRAMMEGRPKPLSVLTGSELLQVIKNAYRRDIHPRIIKRPGR